MHEKELYPAAENFLKTQKNCLAEYVGTELYDRQIKRVDAQIDRLVYDLYGREDGRRMR